MTNRFYKRSFSFFFVVFAVAISVAVYAQSDSVQNGFQNKIQYNLNELQQLLLLNDTVLLNGTFQYNKVENVDIELQKLNLPVFKETAPKTEQYYQTLNRLNSADKQNFIRTFTFYEKEFEKRLKEAGLPSGLKYLAPALSAMNPEAVSKERKAGIWQLTHFQAFFNGLTVTKLIDERFPVSLATTTAVAQLKKNVELFNNLNLAVAAYWLGNVNVRNALHFATENSDEVTRYLPKNYFENVAAFQATALFFSNNKFITTDSSVIAKLEIDTVTIRRQMHFQQISQATQIPVGKLQFLNPQYRFSIIPGDEKPMQLILPSGTKKLFTQLLDSIYNCYDSTLFVTVTQKIEYPPSPNRQYLHEPVKDLVIEGKTKIKYRIKSGDVLGIIAEDFDVRVADLKYWNNIYNERKIRAGNYLDIFVDTDKADYYLKLAGNSNIKSSRKTKQPQKQLNRQKVIIPPNAKRMEHIVKSGESPYTIAKKYKGVTPDNILEWNNIDNARKIQIGQKLVIYAR